MEGKTKAFVGIAGAIIAAVTVMFSTSSDNYTAQLKSNENSTHFIIISGHGGKQNNEYQTYGKQSPTWPDSTKIYEGIVCKIMALKLCSEMMEAGLEVTYLNNYNIDMTLQERVLRVNQLMKQLPGMRVMVISLHLNAQDAKKGDYKDANGIKGFTSTATGGASGIEVYTSRGWTDSDRFVENYLIPELEKAVPEMPWRYGKGQKGKEADFYILKYTNSYTALIEFGFMTTWTDSKLILNKDVRNRYLRGIKIACIKFNKDNNGK